MTGYNLRCMEGERFVLVTTEEEEATMNWNVMPIPCPMQYINCALYFYSHLDFDQIVAGHSQ